MNNTELTEKVEYLLTRVKELQHELFELTNTVNIISSNSNWETSL